MSTHAFAPVLGIEALRAEDFAALDGQRVGLVTNLSAVDGLLVTTYQRFLDAEPVQLTAFFSPEHGFAGTAADGLKLSSSVDPRSGLPVYSLYGHMLAPTPDMLREIDILVCDLPDVGVRYYTYLWTISHILESCGAHGTPVMLLDRPNPLGDQVTGGPLRPGFESFVGRFNVPIRHGMTLGELAQMINVKWNPTPADLIVIPMQGWHPTTNTTAHNRPFVPPSPNLPRLSAVQQYPGACLVEGTTLSEGRGTALPFEVVGAPGLDAFSLTDALNAIRVPGVRFRPYRFTPTASKHAGESCDGVQVHITDAAAYDPINTWLRVILTIRHEFPTVFGWLPPHQPGGLYHFDRLIGSDQPRQLIDTGADVPAIRTGWDDFSEAFRQQRQAYLLYERSTP